MPSITITLMTQQADRLSAAYQGLVNPSAQPTLADLKEYLVKQLRELVVRYERQESMKSAVVSTITFDPS